MKTLIFLGVAIAMASSAYANDKLEIGQATIICGKLANDSSYICSPERRNVYVIEKSLHQPPTSDEIKTLSDASTEMGFCITKFVEDCVNHFAKK